LREKSNVSSGESPNKQIISRKPGRRPKNIPARERELLNYISAFFVIIEVTDYKTGAPRGPELTIKPALFGVGGIAELG
jgi:hypothetical protein